MKIILSALALGLLLASGTASAQNKTRYETNQTTIKQCTTGCVNACIDALGVGQGNNLTLGTARIPVGQFVTSACVRTCVDICMRP